MWETYSIEIEKLEILRTQWYKHITLLVSSLFGILISLSPLVNEERSSVIIFVIALTLLGLTILCFLLKLFGQILTIKKAILRYHDEASEAIKKGKLLPNVLVEESKLFIRVEYFGYLTFLGSIFMLILFLWLTYL
ncbi:hypothetical protein [Ancylomarina subtilis]|nr:hypothetical protein [Ancylomarina subtilis]